MLLKFNILKQKIKSFKFMLGVLLRFKKPTDNIVVICSQQLDEYLVQYHKIKNKSKINKSA
ncbi:aspartyl-phosphate phosphatase Spo0E family protein [Clostridium culturomicium]|uniref:aspartyl-phosphate phosphatase Spo0E family protein n=1 Tax=Clostridium culturomicium TaxID=1499683 RepID=UPI00058F48B6